MAVLEVIVTSLEDARAAQRGGAGRLEVVSGMQHDGLTPDLALVRRLLDDVALPLRFMLRPGPGFFVDRAQLSALCAEAELLRAAGATEYVMGFLTRTGELDLAALRTLIAAASPSAWTLHRAFDHVLDPASAFDAAAQLPSIDRILTSGHPDGLDAGLDTLRARAHWQTECLRFIAGGGLRLEHVSPLRAAGISEFHVGRAVRRGQTWHAPVDEALVRRFVHAIGCGSVPAA